MAIIGEPMWEYRIARELRLSPPKRNKVWAYNVQPGMQLHRPDSTPLLVVNRTDDFDNGDVLITVRMWNPFTGEWNEHNATMRVNILARYELV